MSNSEKIEATIPKDEKKAHCTLYEGLIKKQKFEGNWSIIETNYRDYLVVYSCRPGTEESVYVFTRKPVASEIDTQTVHNILVANLGKDYSQKLRLKSVFQSEAKCSYINVPKNTKF